MKVAAAEITAGGSGTRRLRVGAFVGRHEALIALGHQLAACRVVAIRGAFGVGRARLVRAWAAAAGYAVLEVDALGVADPAGLVLRVQEALAAHGGTTSLRRIPGVSRPLESLQAALTQAEGVVWLVRNADASIALLQGVTLRGTATFVALTLAANTGSVLPHVQLAPLPTDATISGAGEPRPSEAVVLFRTRVAEWVDAAAMAPADIPRLPPSEAEQALVEALDGNPLWIELAAACTLVFSPTQLVARVSHPARNAAPSLPGAWEHAAGLLADLADDDRAILAMLARLGTWFSLEDAMELGAGWHPDPALTLLDAARRHLVEVYAHEDGARRFAVPAPLAAPLRGWNLRPQLLEHWGTWVLDSGRRWMQGTGVAATAGIVSAAVDAYVEADAATTLPASIGPLRQMLGQMGADEALHITARLVAAFGDHPRVSCLDRARLFEFRAVFRRVAADLAGSHADALQALALSHEGPQGRDAALVRCATYSGLSIVHRLRGDDESALESAAAAMSAAREAGDTGQEIQAGGVVVTLLQERGRLDEAEAAISTQLAKCRASGDRRREAATKIQLGGVLRDRGRPDLAYDAYGDARATYEALGASWAVGVAEGHLAAALHEMGRLDEAAAKYAAAIEAAEAADLVRSLLMFRLGYGGVLAELGRVDEANQAWSDVQADMGRFDEPGYAVALRLQQALADAWRCRAARQAGDAERAEQLLAWVLDAIAWANEVPAGAHAARAARLDDARYALRRLRAVVAAMAVHSSQRGVPCLQVSAAGDWFCVPPAQGVSLGRRQVLHRALRTLVDGRLQQPGRAIPIEALMAAVWPGERFRAGAGEHRLRVTMWDLRRLGLGEVLQSESGYRLDPDVALEVVAGVDGVSDVRGKRAPGRSESNGPN